MSQMTSCTACPPVVARPRGLSLWLAFRAMADLRRQRRALRDLDPHLLADIGVTEAEARREAVRPPWDAPENWTQ